jgi:hypothetical protein
VRDGSRELSGRTGRFKTKCAVAAGGALCENAAGSSPAPAIVFATAARYYQGAKFDELDGGASLAVRPADQMACLSEPEVLM